MAAVSVAGSIACTGRLFAQAPHFTQSVPALGANPPLPLSCRVGCPEWRLPIPISLLSVAQTAPAASHLPHLPFFFSRSNATAGARPLMMRATLSTQSAGLFNRHTQRIPQQTTRSCFLIIYPSYISRPQKDRNNSKITSNQSINVM